jgi:hypothetical protein
MAQPATSQSTDTFRVSSTHKWCGFFRPCSGSCSVSWRDAAMGTVEVITVAGGLALWFYTQNAYTLIPGGVALCLEGVTHIAWNRDADAANLAFVAQELGVEATIVDDAAKKTDAAADKIIK